MVHLLALPGNVAEAVSRASVPGTSTVVRCPFQSMGTRGEALKFIQTKAVGRLVRKTAERPFMQPSTVRLIARKFNGGRDRGASVALARAVGVPVKTARAWMTDETDEVNHRRLSRTANRLVTLLAMLEASGIVTERFLVSLEAFEELLEGPPQRLRALMASLEEGDDDAEA